MGTYFTFEYVGIRLSEPTRIITLVCLSTHGTFSVIHQTWVIIEQHHYNHLSFAFLKLSTPFLNRLSWLVIWYQSSIYLLLQQNLMTILFVGGEQWTSECSGIFYSAHARLRRRNSWGHLSLVEHLRRLYASYDEMGHGHQIPAKNGGKLFCQQTKAENNYPCRSLSNWY